MKRSTVQSGRDWERLAREELKKRNYVILVANYGCPYGEIDVVAIEDNCLCFVEVKARQSDLYGAPYEAVISKKLEKIGKTGDYFRWHWKGERLPEASRIDVYSIVMKNGQVIEEDLYKNVTS